MCRRVPTSLRPIFAAAPAAKDELYGEAQVRAALQQYAAANALASGDAAAVKLDRLLHGSLFNKKEVFQEGDAEAVEDLVKRLLGKLQLFHRVVRTSEQVQPSNVLLTSIGNEIRSETMIRCMFGNTRTRMCQCENT